MSFVNGYLTLNSTNLRKGYNWLLLQSVGSKYCSHNDHRNYHVKYILDGSVTKTFEDKEIILKKGQGIIIPPNLSYSIFSEEGYQKLDLVIDCRDPKTTVFQELLKQTNGELAVTNPFNLNISYEQLKYLITVPSDFNYLSIQSKSEGMVLAVLEEIANKEKTEFEQKIERITATEYVKYDLKKLCELTGYSQTHFERLMVKNFGCSGIEYFNRKRINKICDLLTSTKLTLPEIAEKTGFYDTSHLNTFFKKRMVTTPGKYRKIQIE